MALINCSECDKEISDKSAYCINCGCPLFPHSNLYDNQTYVPVSNTPIVYKHIPGKGFGVASMVLGIIGLFFSLIWFLISISTGISDFIIMIVLFLFPVLACIFSYIAICKGYSSGIRRVGQLLGVLSAIILIVGAFVISI